MGYNQKQNNMKKSVIILVLILTSFKVFSQKDSVMDIFYYELDKNRAQEDLITYLKYREKIKAPKENDSHLKKNFIKVFKNPKIWDQFSKNGSMEYIFIQAPETNWYEKEIGPAKSNKNSLCGDPVMIDRTVNNYYNSKIKDFKYDNFEYIVKDWPELEIFRERYIFYLNGEKIRSYSICWEDNKVSSITDWDFEGRK